MKFEFNIQKKHLYIFSIILIVIVGSVFVFAAFSDVPDPGHAVEDLQRCKNDGEILQISGGAWTCATGGGSGTGDITNVIAGRGLSGGGDSGAVNLDVSVGDGLLINSQDRLVLAPCGEGQFLVRSLNVWACSASSSVVNYFSGVTGKPAAIDNTNDFGVTGLIKSNRIACGSTVSGRWDVSCADGDGVINNVERANRADFADRLSGLASGPHKCDAPNSVGLECSITGRKYFCFLKSITMERLQGKCEILGTPGSFDWKVRSTFARCEASCFAWVL